MEDYRRRQPTTASPILQAPAPPTTSIPSIPLSSQEPSFRRIFLALTFFCSSSLGSIFVNKACLTHYKFSFPSTLMVLQAALTILLLSLASRIRPSLVAISPIKAADYHRIFPSTVFFVANVTVGLSALSRVNIPMFSAFRRLTVLFVMGAEYIMLHKTHAKSVIASVFVLTFGAFVSAFGDVTFSYSGYALVFLNNALTAAYLASIKRIMRDLSLDPISLLYYSNILAFPMILCIALVTGDLQQAIYTYFTTPQLSQSGYFIIALSFVSVSAFFVNLSTSICTHVTSPLTTAVAGQVKNVLQSLLGFFSWGYIPTPLNVIGLLVALGGQICFGLFTIRERKRGMGSSAEEKGQEMCHVATGDDGRKGGGDLPMGEVCGKS